MNQKIEKVIIPIAGKGTRFLPVSKAVCKTMFPIINKPAIQYIVEEAVEAKLTHIIIVMNEGQGAVKDYFNNHSQYYTDLNKKSKELEQLEKLNQTIKVDFVVQPHPRGLGDAILCCEDLIQNEDFALMLGDDLVLSNGFSPYGIGDLLEKYHKNPAYYIGVQEVAWQDTKKYGIVKVKSDENGCGLVEQMVEKPEKNPPSNLAGVGRYILKNNVFSYLKEKPYDGVHEIQLTDALICAIQKEPVYARKFQGTRFDVGDKAGYVKANLAFALENPELHQSIYSYIKENIDK